MCIIISISIVYAFIKMIDMSEKPKPMLFALWITIFNAISLLVVWIDLIKVIIYSIITFILYSIYFFVYTATRTFLVMILWIIILVILPAFLPMLKVILK